MKRQREKALENYGKKKEAKRVVEKQSKESENTRERNEESVVREEEIITRECDDWTEWVCSWSSSDGMVDEQMSWGTCWSPVWDMEFIGEAYQNLYNDVLWDDDVWDLKSIKEVPTP